MNMFKTAILTLGVFSLCSTGNMLFGQQTIKIVPMPVKIKTHKGSFVISSNTPIIFNVNDKEMGNIITPLLSHMKRFYGIDGLTASQSRKPAKGSIFIKLDSSSRIKKEGYVLRVRKKGVTLEASSPNGLFYGVQSLIQMMPAAAQPLTEIKLPLADIEDYPRFQWRGLHLDVCRHFMPKEFVFKYIDYMAMHKFNTFHFHLTEDQGWRIEIKKYPRLTEIGSVRKETIIRNHQVSGGYDGTPHGGYYTQDDIRDIVKYAADRYVTVVPEIEMPGHALAALASYPELGCTGGPYEVATSWGVFKDVLCAGKENTFTFLEGVLDEVLDLFPSEYIHVGGDECPKDSWKKCPLCQQRMIAENLKDEHELQSYFIQRMEKYINGKGRKLIGWDEILEGGLAQNAAVMSWRGEEGGIEAASQHHYVVMTPGNPCYLDRYQAEPKTQPFAIGGYVTLEMMYGYEPVPATLTGENASYVLGAQGNVWTEYILSPSHVEYMVYPRAAALSEAVWSPKGTRDYKGFKERMTDQIKRYDVYGINYCREEFK